MMAECEICQVREPSVDVATWLAIMGINSVACPLTPGQTADLEFALRQADEDVAHYVGWWPSPVALCEEFGVRVQYGKGGAARFCGFTRAGLSRWLTLRYGKVQSIDRVEFLYKRGSDLCMPNNGCYTAGVGAVCVVDAEYGSVELDERGAAACCGRNAAAVDRVRIHYTAGQCAAPAHPFGFLLARYAATYLCSPYLCGVDLRCDGWDVTSTTDIVRDFKETIDYTDLARATAETTTTTTKEVRLALPKNADACPFGRTWAGLRLWQFLRPRRRRVMLRA